LQEKVEHHLADEEQEFFQVAGNVLNDRQKTKLADEYQKKMKQELDDEKLTA
ncbi:MAG: hemerythrin domain-containing protein, partial [Pseudomonadota bacterium]|nr:hemerythrin domain-containing protein [Pseudomonadota bacterium]